jgi:hypothetical protein
MISDRESDREALMIFRCAVSQMTAFRVPVAAMNFPSGLKAER